MKKEYIKPEIGIHPVQIGLAIMSHNQTTILTGDNGEQIGSSGDNGGQNSGDGEWPPETP